MGPSPGSDPPLGPGGADRRQTVEGLVQRLDQRWSTHQQPQQLAVQLRQRISPEEHAAELVCRRLLLALGWSGPSVCSLLRRTSVVSARLPANTVAALLPWRGGGNQQRELGSPGGAGRSEHPPGTGRRRSATGQNWSQTHVPAVLNRCSASTPSLQVPSSGARSPRAPPPAGRSEPGP